MHRLDPRESLNAFRRIRHGGNVGASPPTLLAAGFLALIALGTLLLSLPFSGAGKELSLFEAFFTATAAVTVTGLSIVNPQELSLFGQWTSIGLVQIGGLGFVTFAVVSAISLGQRMSLRQQSLALEAFNQTNTAKLKDTALSVIRITILIELSVTALLFLWWWGSGLMSGPTALRYAVFHAIAAFNNAGYSLFDDSLASFTGDSITIAVLSATVILGGLGFPVIVEALRKKRWQALQPYARLMIISALLLNGLGFLLIWTMEADNPATLGSLSFSDQARAAWMQSVALRTAGFTTFNVAAMDDSTTLLAAVLMFIGGGSMSTAGGIKLGTFVVIMAAVFAYLTQRKEVVVLQRSLSPESIQKALAVVVVTMLTAVIALFLLTIFEDYSFVSLFLEVIGALSTAGLSQALTTELSRPSQCVLLVLMFMGRVGPLTLVYSLAIRSRSHSRVRYPEMEFQVG